MRLVNICELVKSVFLKMLILSLVAIGILFVLAGTALASIFTVSNTNDSGTGSLRLAMNNSNNISAGKDTITFTIPGTGPHIIQPSVPLPILTEAVVIDGTTQPGFAPGMPVIVIDGFFAGSSGDGIILRGGDSTVKGLVINRFGDTGIELQSSGNTIEGNFIGVDNTGQFDFGNGGDGIAIFESNNTIGGTTVAERNIISGNNSRGIFINTMSGISSGLVTGNKIFGNYIGVTATGVSRLGNEFAGVVIFNAADNIVGGSNPGAGNVISASKQSNGVWILSNDGSTKGNIVQGNFIGTDAKGKFDFGNALNGVLIQNSFDNIIGGTDNGAGNLISGNNRGVVILNSTATGNLVQGNFIGTDSTGTSALGNTVNGVVIRDASNNTIGGADPAARNIISGNGNHGVRVAIFATSVADDNIIQNNYIGTDVTGSIDLGNGGTGIIVASASNTSILDNVISGNIDGIVLDGTQFLNDLTEGIQIRGNFIGINASGTEDIENRFDGISILRSSNNTIGGSNPADRNVISANGRHGIRISGEGGSSKNNIIQGNHIGLDATGTVLLGNASIGVFIIDPGASETIIGGAANGAGNVIAGQDINIALSSKSDNNQVKGNLIGTDASGNATSGVDNLGVWLIDSSNNEIGGFEVGAGNLIVGHQETGIRIFGGSSNNLIARNIIMDSNIDGLKITETGTRNAIRENSIYSNGGLGIELGVDGVTANDQNDADTGPNNFQNYPLLITATPTNGLAISANFRSLANTAFIIEFFANSACDPSDYGEGQTFIGADTIMTDASGDAFFTSKFSNVLSGNEYITATATDTAGNTSEFCPCIQIETVIMPPDAPDLVAPADAATNVPLNGTFAWTQSSGTDRYHIQLSTDMNFSSIVYEDSSLSGITQTTAQSLESSTKYYWRVRAHNILGWGNYSAVFSFEVGASPIAPSLTNPLDEAIDQPTTVTFTWAPIQAATAYHLQLSTDANFASLVINDSTLADSTHEVESLAEGNKYYWRVRAENSFGWGPYSETRSFEVGSVPAAPALIEPADEAIDLPTTVTFTWAEVQGANPYHLQLSTDTNFSSLVVNDSTLADSTREAPSLAEGTQYYWRVRAENAFGWGPYSETRTFEIMKATSVEEASNIPNAFVLRQNYPNPFNPSTSISYELPKAENVRIVIYDIAGRKVRELVNENKAAGSYMVEWNGRNEQESLVASGLYVYRIYAGEFSQILKMTLIR